MCEEPENNLRESAQSADNLDLGFKVFKLDASNIKPWDADFDNLEDSLFNAVENIKQDCNEVDILYELLLKYGLDLAVPIEKREFRSQELGVRRQDLVRGKENKGPDAENSNS